MTDTCIRVGDDTSFADILSPMPENEFFAEHYDSKPVHIEGGAEKFSSVMSWDGLTAILNMTAAWSPASLQLVLDRKFSCGPAIFRTSPAAWTTTP